VSKQRKPRAAILCCNHVVRLFGETYGYHMLLVERLPSMAGLLVRSCRVMHRAAVGRDEECQT